MSLRSVVVCVALLCFCLVGSAQAAKPSVITKIPGKAYVVRCNAEGTWLAAWSETAPRQYTLYAVGSAKGETREVVKADDPGGICWIPGKNQLLYCTGKAVSNDRLSFTNVTYFLYDVAAGTSRKVTDLKDSLETYIFDPIAADDGNKVFHLTVNSQLPSFNIYFPDSNTMSPLVAPRARIAAEYDLSSDGSMIYWPMVFEDSGHLVIAGWNLEKNDYAQLFEYKKDPAEGRGGFKVDSPNRQAATMAMSSVDPALKAVVYSFQNPKDPQAIPVRLQAGEEVLMLDWKGRSGHLYMLVGRGGTAGPVPGGSTSIIEVNPTNGNRTTLLETTDPVEFVDYANTAGTYFYSTVDPKGRGSTVLLKLQ